MAEQENFLEGFMRLAEGTEIPPAFALWCGLSAVSTVMGRKSWLKAGPFTVYPNLFVVLVAGSGKCRKSTAINQAEELLRLVEPKPNIVAQKLSPEALIQSIRKIETRDLTRLLAEECTGQVIADELATFLNKKTYEAGLASLLIQMYDCKTNFEYRTISRGTESINNACLGLLAGSTVDWLRSGIPEEAVGGGLTSRILFIYVDTPAPPVAWPADDPEKHKLRDRLVRQLQDISTIQGDFSLTQEAMDYYKADYDRWVTKSGDEFYGDKTLSGYASRRHMHMLKVALVISAADGRDRVIKKNHVAAAKGMLEQNEKFLKMVLQLITSTQHGSELTAVLNYITRANKASRTQVMRAMSNRMTSRQLNEVIDSLLIGGQINTLVDGQGTWYVAT